MAESVREETITNNLPSGGHLTKLECAVCLQSCVHPAELPCGHIFCYLCIKGIVNQGRRCAMCRQDIPADYLDKPTLLNPVDAEITSQGFEDGHLWFYEGHNGWWQYDERTSLELESAYQKGERCCDLLIAGFLYVADFDGMLQYRRNDPSRRRRIKRDLATTVKKGIAGLKSTKNCNLTSLSSLEMVSNNMIQNLPVSNSSALNNLNGIRIFTSGLSNSGQQTDRVQGPQRPRGISSSCSLSTSRPTTSTNSNAVAETDSPLRNSANLNLDSAIHDTLDWTIEQIESLNLELLNDYETLFRDVNNYGRLQGSLNQSQFRRPNYINRYLSTRNTSSDIPGSGLDTINTVADPSQTNNDHLNNLPTEPSPVSSEENEPIYSEVAESPSDPSLMQPIDEIPQPPPRNRGMSRSRSRGDSLRHSSILNCDALLQRFVSNK